MQQVVSHPDETDDGKPKASPSRTCIATREIKPVGELIRFVRAPSGAVTPDLKAVLPGRGVWISAHKADVAKAVKSKAFQSSLKTDVTVDPALPDEVGALLKARSLQALSFASKAGEVVCGATKIEKTLQERVLALLHATDGRSDGIEKLNRLFRAACGREAPVFRIFSNAELDMALGRSNVIHAALRQGGAAEACLQCLHKVTIYEA